MPRYYMGRTHPDKLRHYSELEGICYGVPKSFLLCNNWEKVVEQMIPT